VPHRAPRPAQVAPWSTSPWIPKVRRSIQVCPASMFSILISSLRADKRFLERRILTSSILFGPWRMWFLDGYWLRFFFQSAAVLLPTWCDGATAACWDDWIYPGANDYSTICWMPRPPCETVRWCLPVLVQSRSPLSSVCTSAPAYFVLAPAWDGSRKLQSSLHLCFLLIVQVMQ